ncbi:MAG: hypothetical protein IPJ89_00975 [Candidatus Iainarchaeum archaeon]|uniref:Uncharacterized protein n=1 Tax=Candidatus Iainarchaeum sp. TaxID=3101447 RepID=A0A7T9DK43_9ARCH|nr:MAG: hypothetical protein IPJ89_00975 [Candidatus Diapherotrites archaeon]
MSKSYFIQYKFILPESVKHSTYTYQKLFRAIYGYTQNVTKSNGKTYHYFRKGVLSDTPYYRPGKNSVIISPEAFPKLKQFFATGQNPSHKWITKGDWKAVYYMDEKELEDMKVVQSLEDLLDRTYITADFPQPQKILTELSTILDTSTGSQPNLDVRKRVLLSESQAILSHEWFQQHHPKSKVLTEFNDKVKQLKGL